MSKSLGYWGCVYDYPLITDVADTFKDNLQELNETDQAWLLGKLGHHYWEFYCDDSASDAADEVITRLYELPRNQVACLLRAVINKSSTKPLTYWGCNHELQLVEDIADTWGWNLQNLSELDYYWLIARLGAYYWMRHCDDAPSEAAEELVNRLEELPQNQIPALIRAIANK
jgi:hypothetical protein